MPNKRKPPVKKAIRPQVAYSSEEDEAGGFTVTGAEAVLGSDGAPPASTGEALPRELPCTLNGINAGLGGGALGYVFGFGELPPALLCANCSTQGGHRSFLCCRQPTHKAQRERQVQSLHTRRLVLSKGV